MPLNLNRTIVECKFSSLALLACNVLHLNRTIVECKLLIWSNDEVSPHI